MMLEAQRRDRSSQGVLDGQMALFPGPLTLHWKESLWNVSLNSNGIWNNQASKSKSVSCSFVQKTYTVEGIMLRWACLYLPLFQTDVTDAVSPP